jgi:hypothetical protein
MVKKQRAICAKASGSSKLLRARSFGFAFSERMTECASKNYILDEGFGVGEPVSELTSVTT